MKAYRDQFIDADQVDRYESEQYGSQSWSSLLWRFEQQYLDMCLDDGYPVQSGPQRKYVDFACGTGRVLEHVAPRFGRVIGIDVSSEMLSRVAQRVPSAETQCRNIADDPTPLDHKADLITCFRFLLNADPNDRQRALQWMAQQLTTTGVLIINNHGSALSHKGLAHIALARGRKGPRLAGNILSDRAARRLFDSAGLRVIAMHGIGYLGGTLMKSLGFRRTLRLQEAFGSIPILGRFGEDQIYVLTKKVVPADSV